MRLLKSEEGKTYQIDWNEEVKQYFERKLNPIYANDVCKKLAEYAVEQIQIPCGKDSFVVSLGDNYYVIKDMQLSPISLNDEILPKSDLENPFLNKIFESKNWQDCITHAKPETNDFPLMSIDYDGKLELITLNLNETLSKYFSALDLIESVKIQLLELMGDAIGVIFSKWKGRYVIYKDAEGLKVKESKLEREKIREIILSAFHMIESEPYELLSCEICNKLLYGEEISLSLEIYGVEISEIYDSYFMLKGIWHYKGKQYKTFMLSKEIYIWNNLNIFAIIPKEVSIEKENINSISYLDANKIVERFGLKLPFDFDSNSEAIIQLSDE